MRTYEFRDPIHGYIKLNELERDLVNSPEFQRLRRIKQLAWTDMVYPGATHTRFEHSLGVMHVASSMFDALHERDGEIFHKLEYSESGATRLKQLVRLAALMHDLGHSPFSHAGEDLFPTREDNPKKRYEHEDYSAKIIEFKFKDIIENHPINVKNFGIKIDDVTDFFTGAPKKDTIVLKELVSGQMDADRMDYMLRDSLHTGVSYGKYDLQRVIATIKLVEQPIEEESGVASGDYTLGICEDGIHAVEGLIIARYMMFTQVYFHKTRVIYDYHLSQAMGDIVRKEGGFPPPTTCENITKYLEWDDWKVCGALRELNTIHSKALIDRKHFRLVHWTPEAPEESDMAEITDKQERLTSSGITSVIREASKSWYKFDNPTDEILVHSPNGAACRLTTKTKAVKDLPSIRQKRLYVSLEDREKAVKVIKG